MTFSPFDHPIVGGLLGDEEIAGYFSAEAELRAMLDFEAALAKVEARAGVIPAEAASRIAEAAQSFKADVMGLRLAAAKDGVAVPELVRQLREAVGGEASRYVHFGATSQDVVDTGLMLRLKPALAILETRLGAYVRVLADLDSRFESNTLTGYTRMQAALPINVADRLRAWSAPAKRSCERIGAWRENQAALQFGGAAGTLEKLGDKAPQVRSLLAAELGLGDVPQWHSQRDRLADLSNILSLVTGALGKFGQDVALMSEMSAEIALAGGGSSSAMPHKRNPVQAELLVALARFNAVLSSGMHHALVHEQERSGAAWTLEWMILPQMMAAAAAATRTAHELSATIITIGVP